MFSTRVILHSPPIARVKAQRLLAVNRLLSESFLVFVGFAQKDPLLIVEGSNAVFLAVIKACEQHPNSFVLAQPQLGNRNALQQQVHSDLKFPVQMFLAFFETAEATALSVSQHITVSL